MVKTNFSREQIIARAIKYMAQKNFNLESRSEYQLVFTGGKDINTLFLAFWILFFLVGGIIYYLSTKSHSITISIIDTANGVDVRTSASTDLSRLVADEFLQMLETFDYTSYLKGYKIQEMKCPKCGSVLDFTGREKIVSCNFCGSNLSINEIRENIE